MIAQVIVDVSAYPVDRPFDYRVPHQMHDLIEAGSRVKVPFGHRDVLGFIVGLSDETDVPVNKIKEVSKLVDIEPVLTTEMLEMAKWMTHKTLCYEIDALQVMLPAALRAKYEKTVHILVSSADLEPQLATIFGDKKAIPYRKFEQADVLLDLKRAVKAQQLQIITVVKQQGAIKSIRKFVVSSDEQFLNQQLDALSNRARKQKQAIEWMKQHIGERFLPQELIDDHGISASVQKAIVDLGVATFVEEELYRDPFSHDVQKSLPLALTDEQQEALQAIENSMNHDVATTFLLHGITGSGKTEVYLQAISNALAKGKESIVLVPEIALTPQMTERFRARFGELVAVMHSGLSQGEKYDEWRKIQRGEVKVVVGARSAIFAPFTNVGLLILDEEHESTYKQEDTPRYHARDVAIWRGRYYNCPVILGSATPALESYARAKKRVYELLTLNNRAKNQVLPSVEIVDMRDELHEGNRSMFSRSLAEAIRQRLKRKEQMVLFLNRRGFSSFVLCRDCGTVVQCKNCDISLTYHRNTEKLKCHYCGYEEHVPEQCPQCQSEHIRFFGTGTQKIESEIYKVFPEARVIRMDVDTTRQKGAHERLLTDFGEGKADILLGTQMIAKGLDFPNITLVGVMSADTSLNLPDFRAAERTYQLLTQVSGRAGRHDLPGEVVIQTYTPEHYAIEMAKDQIFEPFFEREMTMRRRSSYPPYYFVVVIQVTHEDVMKCAEYATMASDFVRMNLSQQVQIIGPTASSISRIQNRYRYQCLIKYKREPQLNDVLKQLIKLYRTDWIKKGVLMTVDLDPSTI
ncbi:primosomal protein N' [Kurthia sibirica]|uniref:Replication restart protein PriA n=1 Tax=Kurthia sibirica TaxID=202750 RepID=A0A2U3AQL7_9BACL|nr:primosomal protein N' [Kurthia sibirica]PWI26848.1 primosomal protein N' [Kurthia sibirica]GEK32615.1 primosomal protein N' [Kurthia sibirica]